MDLKVKLSLYEIKKIPWTLWSPITPQKEQIYSRAVSDGFLRQKILTFGVVYKGRLSEMVGKRPLVIPSALKFKRAEEN